MKRPIQLHTTLLTEFGELEGVATERDSEVIQNRCKYEGLSFLTITLPSLDDLLLKGIECGRFPSSDCSAFALNRQRSLPRFLGGFFKRIFALDGSLLDEPDIGCIFAIRQITRFYKKLKLPCSGDREVAAIKAFVKTEEGLYHAEESIVRHDPTLDSVAMQLWSGAFLDLDYNDLFPRHGPGATAERYLANARNRIRTWYSRIEESYPSDLFAIPNFGFADELRGIDYLDVRDEIPVRVVFVPKTLRSPRVIAIEPSHMQYVQQALLRFLVNKLETSPLTRESVRFSDQSVNVERALDASKTRRFATMDLSEASDRVSLRLVQRIFARSNILPYLEDGRSLSATLPNGDNILLKKFASMGSALCFPVEAMVFYTLLQACLHRFHGRVPSSRSIREFSKLIDVYGDDIIIPSGYVAIVAEYLESYGLKVNRSKTFSRSHFRESCGGDFYKGIAVKPVYAREVLPDRRQDWDAATTFSWADTSDQFYEQGLWRTAQLIRDQIQARWGEVPLSPEKGEGLSFKSAFQRTLCRYDPSLHRYVQKRVCFIPKKVKDDISSDAVASFNKRWLQSPVEKQWKEAWRSRLSFLEGDVTLDYVSITKRGVFTPKRRWVTAQ